MHQQTRPLTCNVLGPTEIVVDGVAVELGGPIPRRIVTALVAAGGRALSYTRLAEVVWGERNPAHARATLQVYVSRLRGLLGADRERLARDSTGYQLVLPPQGTDVERFGAGIARARQLLDNGDPVAALRGAGQALKLWRGRPYRDLRGHELAEAETTRLLELHEVAVETRAAARLACGDAASTVPELDALTTEAPYRETRWALLVLALYRSGRQADALSALRRARTVLAGDLGIDPGQELRDLERRVLAQDPHLLLPAPPRAALPPPRRLAMPLTSFTGRERELAALASAARTHRLVTLVGSAGVGKTRLALEYVNGLAEPDGPWLVRLADVHDGTLLAQTVATTMGVAGGAVEAVLATCAGTLVLDNCEHLTEAVAGFVLHLLTVCPSLRVLVTSREHLALDGEQVLPVAPLAVTAPDGGPGPAIELLTNRIRAVRPGWTPAAEDLRQVEQLCTALDGLPLALELAAARTRVLGLAEIVERLDDRFAVFGRVPRGSVAAHSSLRAAIEWSVHLLSATDRDFLYRLWPFDGGFTFEAAAAVQEPAASSFESLSSLVAKSVVEADTTANPTRYRLLESVRAYCREHDTSPEGAGRHAAWVRDLVDAHSQELLLARGGATIRLLTAELPNLRAGIRHDIGHAPELALRTIGLLSWFWIRGGHFGEAERLLDAAFAAAPDADPLDRARALMVRGDLLSFGGAGLLSAEPHYLAAVALTETGDSAEHRALRGLARYQSAFGGIALRDVRRATEYAGHALAASANLDLPWLTNGALMVHGAALVLRGDHLGGEAGLREAVAMAQEHGLTWLEAWAHHHLGQSQLSRGEGVPALASLRTALDRYLRTEDITFTLIVLLTMAAAIRQLGDPATAGVLVATVDRKRRRHGIQPGMILQAATSLIGDVPPYAPTSALDWADTLTLARTWTPTG
ncbi:BTAD domain-containing putative transcriptional regulator [Crossiella cryophila]|uniref:Putative ATPase/DNA-binding SARP family transcriptional activator n=1 Tax=Crossiella cryophila TaxID=43355 RepID=A0A7W7CCQ1_9PSEU|nr:BTAD domain-containing putative transcriptional regulator [Crossiella cryophila]MBB4678760.1 putative ATPase/DNA-binding SARP family transcriptional activator [Crossiella cryophila]